MKENIEDLDPNTPHYCGKCNKKVPGYNFHLAAGYCDDCYREIEDWRDETEFNEEGLTGA